MGGEGTDEAVAAACVGRVALLTLVLWARRFAGVALDAFSGYFGYQVIPPAALRSRHGCFVFSAVGLLGFGRARPLCT